MSAADGPYKNQPIYWFVILDRAVERGDTAQAALAERELLRLGVAVTIDPHRRQEVVTR